MKEEKLKEEVRRGDEILKHQLEFYKKNNIPVHIIRTDERFYNGSILELAGDMLILDDIKLGAMPIHFIEIKVLERYTKEGRP